METRDVRRRRNWWPSSTPISPERSLACSTSTKVHGQHLSERRGITRRMSGDRGMESLGASRNGSGAPLAVLARQWAPNGFDLLAFCLLAGAAVIIAHGGAQM